MANRDSIRRTRLRGRFGGNRPRTHPKGPSPGAKKSRGAVPIPPLQPKDSTQCLSVLAHVRGHLVVILASLTTAAMALQQQNTENDAEVALMLRRCVADQLFLQIEHLDRALKAAGIPVTTMGAS
jgi:hypothetical protein